MHVGTQFTGTLGANATHRWFTHSWPAAWQVHWSIVPTTPRAGGPQVEWDVALERTSAGHLTYWLTVRNLTGAATDIEGRYAVLP